MMTMITIVMIVMVTLLYDVRFDVQDSTDDLAYLHNCVGNG